MMNRLDTEANLSMVDTLRMLNNKGVMQFKEIRKGLAYLVQALTVGQSLYQQKIQDDEYFRDRDESCTSMISMQDLDFGGFVNGGNAACWKVMEIRRLTAEEHSPEDEGTCNWRCKKKWS
jgi:hypothetical protein